jgi:hypothetical protein
VVYDQSFDNAPIVFLDANLLYPFHLRNLLVQLSVERLVKVRWSDAVHEEWISNLAADGRVTRDRLQRTREIMDHVLPDAAVRGYERHIERLSLPDQNDRHVLAAAIEAGASIILTFNLKDFPPEQLASHRIVSPKSSVASRTPHPARATHALGRMRSWNPLITRERRRYERLPNRPSSRLPQP